MTRLYFPQVIPHFWIMRLGMRLSLGLVLLGFWGAGMAHSAVTNTAPDFKEVYDLVRQHLLGTMSEEQVNRAAVKGLVKALYPQVQLLGSNEETASGQTAVTKSSLFEGGIAYLRVARVDDGLAAALRQAYEKMAATNKVNGLALDLRYAGGQDYAAAVAIADLFVRKEQPLLDWGTGVVRSHEKSDALAVPVAVLINAQTAGSAEALAALLREAAVGLLLGNKTAGEALAGEEFALKNGERLRIATSPVRLGDGTPLVSVKPDISVNVTPEEERAYYADSFLSQTKTDLLATASSTTASSGSTTNRAARRARPNEAELVRERREGISLDSDLESRRERESDRPVVSDPVLARALDLLKGLAVVRHTRS